MGSNLSRLQHVERLLHAVRPEDVNLGVTLSIGIQLLAYYCLLGPWIAYNFKNPAMPSVPAQAGGALYAQNVMDRYFKNLHPHVLLAMVHQMMTSHLVVHQMIHKRVILPTVMLAGSSCVMFTYVAWFYPIKMLASAVLVSDGQAMTYLHLKEVFETSSESQQRQITTCNYSGIGLMTGALLTTYTKMRKPMFVWVYLLYAGMTGYWGFRGS
jgi:hypothetical protein